MDPTNPTSSSVDPMCNIILMMNVVTPMCSTATSFNIGINLLASAQNQ